MIYAQVRPTTVYAQAKFEALLDKLMIYAEVRPTRV